MKKRLKSIGYAGLPIDDSYTSMNFWAITFHFEKAAELAQTIDSIDSMILKT